MTYSQNGEDLLILKHFGGSTGTVLDIGAALKYSNSRLLIERGWKAVLIEPSPTAFRELLDAFDGNQNVRLINAAMGVENTLRTFYEFPNDLCSTFDKWQAAKWAETGRKMRQYLVPQITPAMLVNQVAGGYDVISIDCEGASCDILRALPIGAWTPQVIVVEHDSKILEMSGWAKEKGYEIAQGGLSAENLILVRKS